MDQMNRFIKLDTENLDKSGFETLIQPVNISKPKALSEFFSQLYALLGEPNNIRYEGYSYCIKDTKTGFIFTAELNQFGQGYSGKKEALEVIQEFDQLRQVQEFVDCSLEYEHDYGTTTLGSKNGVLIEKHTE